MNGIGSHQSARMKNDEWLTPPEIIKALGPFDLDPCAPIVRPWDMATNHFTIQDDGLNQLWRGFVWCNPPYGRETERWLLRMSQYHHGIALIFARTETKMFQKWVWKHATSLLFIYDRLYFHHVTGERAKANSGAPSVLVGYGDLADQRLRECSIKGKYVKLYENHSNF